MVGQVFESKRTDGVKVRIISQDEKFNTVTFEYLEGEKEGTRSSITTSTLKRWWKKIEVKETTFEELQEDITEVVMEQKKELEIEVPVINPVEVHIVDKESELTDEQYAQIGLEIDEQAKKKEEEHNKSKKVKSESAVFDLTKIDSAVVLKAVPSDSSNFRITVNEKTVGEIFIRKSFIFVCTRKQVAGYEISTKSYRPYPEYHKVTTVEDISKIVKEII